MCIRDRNLNATFHTVHPDLELAHHELGQLYLNKDSFGPAISNLKASTRLASKIWGDASLMYARGANQLGVAYHRAGQNATALEIHKAAELIRVHKLGEDDPLVAHSRLNMASANFDMRAYGAAEEDLKKAVAAFDVADPAQAHLKNLGLARLSTVYMLTNRPNQAEPILADLLKLQEADEKAPPIDLADLQYRLGIAQARQGKYDAAEPILREAYATQKRIEGPSGKSTIKSMQAIALLLKQTRRTEESTQLENEIRRVAKHSDTDEFVR